MCLYNGYTILHPTTFFKYLIIHFVYATKICFQNIIIAVKIDGQKCIGDATDKVLF